MDKYLFAKKEPWININDIVMICNTSIILVTFREYYFSYFKKIDKTQTNLLSSLGCFGFDIINTDFLSPSNQLNLIGSSAEFKTTTFGIRRI
jgi:hypothetical protein